MNWIEGFFVNGFFEKIEEFWVVKVSRSDELRDLDWVEKMFEMIFLGSGVGGGAGCWAVGFSVCNTDFCEEADVDSVEL